MSDTNPITIVENDVALIDTTLAKSKAQKGSQNEKEADLPTQRRCRLRNNNSIAKEEFLTNEDASPHEVNSILFLISHVYYFLVFIIFFDKGAIMKELGL